MRIDRARLKTVNDKTGKATGEFECTLCGERFRSDLGLRMGVATKFSTHRTKEHEGVRAEEAGAGSGNIHNRAVNYIEELRKAIEYLHKVDSKHTASVAVKERVRARVPWDGMVEVFDLRGHRFTEKAYAWVHQQGGADERYVTVLHIKPVVSPLTAVRAGILRDFRNIVCK